MRGNTTLHQRVAWGAAPMRCWPASARPGTRVCVIVPSKDNASGSSGKRVPLLWTFPDTGSSSRGVLKHKQALEEVFSREVEEPTAYHHSHEHQANHHHHHHQQQNHHPQGAASQGRLLQPEEEEQQRLPRGLHVNEHVSQPQEQVEAEELDLEALRERLASAALASTSASAAPSSSSSSSPSSSCLSESARPHAQSHDTSSRHNPDHKPLVLPHQANHHGAQTHQQHQHRQPGSATTALHALTNGVPISNGSLVAHVPLVNLTQQQQQQQDAGDNGARSNVRPAITAGAVTVAAGAQAVSAADPTDGSIPGSIWILCCISAALTCASCIFNTALPIYMVSELKMSMRSMGMFEGLLEAFSYVVRMCSGVISDRMTSRKAAITLGFAAGAAAKFGMASASTVGLLFAGKAVDRLANGIQAAPRDALIGDLSPAGVRSACFGLAQSLRKWGSAVGALAAFFLMKASNNNYQLIFYSAASVSLIACLAFVAFVPAHTRVTNHLHNQQPEEQRKQQQGAAAAAGGASSAAAPSGAAAAVGGFLSGARELLRSAVSMGPDFYRMLGVISLYALGHINESLLEARAIEVGFGKAEATLVVAAIAAVTFLTAYPLGRLDDRYGAGTTFAVGIGALIAGDLVLLLSGPHPLALFASCLFLGVHWAVIQGPLLSIVSGLAPAHLRGTAFGIFYTVMAITAVGANTMYGTIWHTYGANAAFATSAALMSAVLAALPYMLPASARRGAAVTPPPPPATVPSMAAAGSPLPAAA